MKIDKEVNNKKISHCILAIVTFVLSLAVLILAGFSIPVRTL